MTGRSGDRSDSSIDPTDVRRSVIAGTWYPGNPTELRSMIEQFLSDVPPLDVGGQLIGLVVPHAGYVYSGPVAARAYALLRDQSQRFSRAAVISPVHRIYPGQYATTAKRYYETPLGLVRVDEELVGKLASQLDLNRVTSDMEHSLEIQLPFLQYVLGEFTLLPVMMGDQDWPSAQELGEALAAVVGGEDAVLIASTDLSHFHSSTAAHRLDHVVLDRISALDPQGLMESLARHKAEACGGGPVSAVMVAAKLLGATSAKVLQYQDSGDVTGDHSNVVGYAAAAFLAG